MIVAMYVLIALLSALVIAFTAVISYGLAQNRGKTTRIFVTALSVKAAVIIIAIIFCAALLPDYWLELGVKASEVFDRTLKIIALLAAALLADIAALLILAFRGKAEKNHYFTSRNITRLAIFTAISYILYVFLKFNLPIFPSFLDMQISDMPALLAGFMMGPVSGVIVIALKVALKLPFSSTAFVGELADFLIGIAFVLPASLIYKFKRTKKGAIFSLMAGSLTCVFTAVLLNRYMLVPFYVELYFGGKFESIVKMLAPLYKGINKENFYTYYLWAGVLPFNALRCFCSVLVTFLIYKRTEKIFSKMFADIYKPKIPKKLKMTETENIESKATQVKNQSETID